MGQGEPCESIWRLTYENSLSGHNLNGTAAEALSEADDADDSIASRLRMTLVSCAAI